MTKKKIELKAITVISLLAFILTFIPSVDIPVSKDTFEFDAAANEGYVAFIVNGYQAPKPDGDGNVCDCKGTGTITHGDGHKTPCPCIGSGDGCPCKPLQSVEEWEEDVEEELELLIPEEEPEVEEIEWATEPVIVEDIKIQPKIETKSRLRIFGN
jgi:hypothetical protein